MRKVGRLTEENQKLSKAAAAAEARAVKAEKMYNDLKLSADKDVEIAVLKTKMQGGLLMLQRADVRSGSEGTATPGPGEGSGSRGLPTPSALEQFFSA